MSRHATTLGTARSRLAEAPRGPCQDPEVTGPLHGIRVLDLTTVFSGPYATLMLADLGADVVKVEVPGGDIVRRIGPGATMGPLFLAIGRNKRSVSLDLKHDEGRALLGRLIDSADVLMHNMRPAAAQRIGADPATARARNPRLVHCAISGFGAGGPYEDLPAYDDVIQAASGMAALQAQKGDPPTYVRTVVADKTAGLFAFGAVCAALVQRDRTGEGATIEVPMYEAFTSFLLMEHLYGLTYDPPLGEAGYERVTSPDRRPFRTADGWIGVVFYNEAHWRGFFELIGRPELITDPRFAEHRARIAHTDVLYAMVADAMAQRTTAECLELLRELDVPAMPVQSIDEVLADPHLAAVGLFVAEDHPTEGRYTKVRNPIVFSTGVDDGRVAPAAVGQHTREVLSELGCSETEIRRLVDEGVAQTAD